MNLNYSEMCIIALYMGYITHAAERTKLRVYFGCTRDEWGLLCASHRAQCSNCSCPLGLVPGMITWIWKIPIDTIYWTQKNWKRNLMVLLSLNCCIVLMINLEKSVQSANFGRGTHGRFLIHSNFTVFYVLYLYEDTSFRWNSCYMKEWILNLKNIYATGMKEGSCLNVVYNYENLSCMRGGQQGIQASICPATLLLAALWHSPFIPSNLYLLNIGFLQQRKGRWLL